MEFAVVYECYEDEQAKFAEHAFSMLAHSYCFLAGFNTVAGGGSNSSAQFFSHNVYDRICVAIGPDVMAQSMTYDNAKLTEYLDHFKSIHAYQLGRRKVDRMNESIIKMQAALKKDTARLNRVEGENDARMWELAQPVVKAYRNVDAQELFGLVEELNTGLGRLLSLYHDLGQASRRRTYAEAAPRRGGRGVLVLTR